MKDDSYDISYIKIINKESKEEFENELKENSLWQEKLGSKIRSILPLEIQISSESLDGEYGMYFYWI